MRVLARNWNDCPEAASRPMSATAGGFVPSSGAGLLMVESLSSARARGARIYAEILGGHVNCGGQRGGGSMTAPESRGGDALHPRGAGGRRHLGPGDIDAINGHLTATMADTLEIGTWRRALGRAPEAFPWINSTKSLIGHGLGAAGGVESVAAVLQVSRGFVHGSLNCEDLHPELAPFAGSIPHQTIDVAPRVLAKASFGFGDVNGCLIIGSDGNSQGEPMDSATAFGKVTSIIKPFVKNATAFESANDGTRIIEDLGVNSARLVDIILAFEDEFGIEVDDDSADKVRTLGDAVQMIQQKTAAAH